MFDFSRPLFLYFVFDIGGILKEIVYERDMEFA